MQEHWTQYVSVLWPIIAVGGGIVTTALIWCLRLEGKTSLHKELADEKHDHAIHRIEAVEHSTGDLYSKHGALNEKLSKDIGDIGKTLARIEGRLGIKSDE